MKQSEKRKSLCSNMEADPTFHFYCNNDGRDGGRNEFFDDEIVFPVKLFYLLCTHLLPTPSFKATNNVLDAKMVLKHICWLINIYTYIYKHIVSKMGNNFDPTTPTPPPPQEKKLALLKTPQWRDATPPDHLTSDKIYSDSFIKK